ncbi:hypothetical protein L8P89_20445 [Enterobacter roggenkampii]|uniref:hypothetical protein n=1 Tax=Enterobacter roggenkampii TaxID=1812935 RepID=UPI002004D6DD|nr:hypothetical protein [Enterobacter roggenkampii]MCK7077639.1 hypothetical protein [Enterobacter roggenkampii]HCM9504766.1 hypothetical protein [Enterobacter roggenkampii]
MNNVVKPPVENIFDVIQGGSYTETLYNIQEISKGNESLRDILLLGFYQNPKKDIHHQVNAVYGEIINEGKKKNWLCGHEHCEKPSAYSHELSEKSVLIHLADCDNKAFVLKRDLKNNSFFFSFCNKHIRDITNFPGYCSEHDQKLFHFLDQPSSEINLEYVNLQALKMLKYRLFSLEKDLRLTKGIILQLSSIVTNHTDDEVYIEAIRIKLNDMQEKSMIIADTIEKSEIFYGKLLSGIRTKEFVIEYDEIPCEKKGWVFSQSYDGDADGCSERIFSFIFKVDTNSRPVLIHAWNKSAFQDDQDKYLITQDEIIKFILLSKEKLVFSAKFLTNLDDAYLQFLLGDEEIFNYSESPIHRLLFKNILLSNN